MHISVVNMKIDRLVDLLESGEKVGHWLYEEGRVGSRSEEVTCQELPDKAQEVTTKVMGLATK